MRTLAACITFSGALAACGDSTDSNPEIVLHDRILFEAAGGIGVMAPDGIDRHVIPTGSDLVVTWSPSASPDGRWLAFMGNRDRGDLGWQCDLYIIRPDGTGRLQLTDDFDIEGEPRWSPDGASLLVTWSPHSTPLPVRYLHYRLDRSAPREILRNAWASDLSPDGTRIVFQGTDALENGIYVANANGSNVQLLPRDCVNCYDQSPRWSPDGSRIAFSRSDELSETVWVMNADGSAARPLIHMPATQAVRHPVWSPDGERLAVSLWTGLPPRIYLLSVATGDTVVVSPPTAREFPTHWVP
jgi:Tol biopolymer transport system component